MIKKLIIISLFLLAIINQIVEFNELKSKNSTLTESEKKLKLQKEYLISEDFKAKNQSDLIKLSQEFDLISKDYDKKRLELKLYIETLPKKLSTDDKIKKIKEKRESPDYNQVAGKYFNLADQIKTVKNREVILKDYIQKEDSLLKQSQSELTLKYKKNLFGILWYLAN